jgi:hypothetical protein
MIVKSEDLERAIREREPGKDLIVQADWSLENVVSDHIKANWESIVDSNPLLQRSIAKH